MASEDREGDARILVVDDDETTRRLLRRILSMEGYDVIEAPDAPSALSTLARQEVDLMLLDVMMPGQDGLELLAQIRRKSDLPVIMLTAKADEPDRVLGLKAGADDYVVKPFSTAELLARIEAVLRRAPHRRPPVLQFDGLQIDPDNRQVRVGGVAVEVPAREFDLLVHLASSPGRAFSREQLLAAVWPPSPQPHDPGTVTEHARRLRLRLEEDPDQPRWIKTVRGVGYRFEP